jgi:SAM-dependent methyltransferase
MGLNARELENNKRLTDFIVHDLNAEPAMPLPDNAYDAVICTVSVEYLTQPIAVFREVARVLKPGGRFILTFSNRWFPPKAIQIWKELHEFERMGLVLEYFHKSAAFKNLETYSIRGLMRPFNDKYYGQLPYSDPVYVVCGERMAT